MVVLDGWECVKPLSQIFSPLCIRDLYFVIRSGDFWGVVSLKTSTPYNEGLLYVVEGLVHSLSAAAVNSMQMLKVGR